MASHAFRDACPGKRAIRASLCARGPLCRSRGPPRRSSFEVGRVAFLASAVVYPAGLIVAVRFSAPVRATVT